MLALCLILLGSYTYYAQNYAGIIGWCLIASAYNETFLHIAIVT